MQKITIILLLIVSIAAFAICLHSLKKEQIKETRQIYESFDLNKDGVITQAELKFVEINL